jgi:hypothetical protein
MKLAIFGNTPLFASERRMGSGYSNFGLAFAQATFKQRLLLNPASVPRTAYFVSPLIVSGNPHIRQPDNAMPTEPKTLMA